jgi:hypothetical protein
VDVVQAESAPPADRSALLTLLPVGMLVGSIGMTAFLAVAFGGRIALLFGGMVILIAISVVVQSRRPRRWARLVTLGVLVAASVGIALVVLPGNPSGLLFVGMTVLSVVGMLFSGPRRIPNGPVEDELKE